MISSERFAVDHRALRRHFDLSRKKSLQTLEITVMSIIAAGPDNATGPNNAASKIFQTFLSSVTSPVSLSSIGSLTLESRYPVRSANRETFISPTGSSQQQTAVTSV